MLHITPAARDHLVRLRQNQGLDDRQAARFVAHEGKVRLTFAPSAQPGDLEVNASGIRVLLAPEVADGLSEAVVTARDQDGRAILVIQRTNGTRPS